MKYLFKYNNFFYNYNFFKLKIIIFYRIFLYAICITKEAKAFRLLMDYLIFSESLKNVLFYKNNQKILIILAYGLFRLCLEFFNHLIYCL